jgi:hypothetical protein
MNVEQINLNLSGILDNIINNATNIEKEIAESAKYIHDLLGYDNQIDNNDNIDDSHLLEYHNITSEKIELISMTYLENIQMFCNQLKYINNDDIDEYTISDLKNLIFLQEITIYRLQNLLTTELNEQLKNTENTLKKFINNFIIDYDLEDKINILAEKDIFFNHILFRYNYSTQIDLSISSVNSNIQIENTEDIDKLFDKYTNIQIIKNNDDKYKWNNDILLYELKSNNNKLYIYIDLYKNCNEIINLDFDNKIFCIVASDINNLSKLIDIVIIDNFKIPFI